MGLSSDELLLTDARLVHDYALRTGRLPDDSLSEAIAACEDTARPVPREFSVRMAAALNAVIPRIAPMTLVDLRAGRSPFDERQFRRNVVVQSALGCFALLLVTLVAWLSYDLHDETSALAIVQKISDAHLLDKLTDVRLIAQRGEVFKHAGMELEDYHRRIRELRDLYDQLNGSRAILQRFLYEPGTPSHAGSRPGSPAEAQGSGSSTAPERHSSSPSAMPGQAAYAAERGPQDQQGSSSGSDGAPDSTQQAVDGAKAAMSLGAQAPVDVCSPAAIAQFLEPFKDSWIHEVIADSLNEYCFSTKLNFEQTLGYTGHSYGVQTGDIYRLQNNVAYLTSWILPVLYGLLGSVVFLMRSSLDPRTPNPDVMAVVLRIVLGGVSGLAIGWFWKSGTNLDGGPTVISSIPFAISFLAGFSIDVLFSLLDRMVKGSQGPTSPA